jgi:hypothetical protein
MSISQGYTGSTSHSPHNTGSPKDYPWDEACENSGRSPMYCPCDEMKIVKIYTKGTNTFWLESTTKCDLADGTSDFVTLLVTHPNDSDIARLKVGQKFKRGDLICYEGTDGNATGNHFHFSAGKGKISGGGWIQNSKGKWVLTCTGGGKKPETLFFIDPNFTTSVIRTKNIQFKNVPKNTEVKPTQPAQPTNNFFPSKGYLQKGDKGKSVELLCNFFTAQLKGDYFGDYLEACMKVYQKQNGLTQDGKVGPLTLKELEKDGFKY